MTLALDAITVFPSAGTGAGDESFTHTPVGTPRGVIAILVCSENADNLATITYGGDPLTDVTDSPQIQTAGAEFGGIHILFLGTSIPTGPQTVVVDSSTFNTHFIAIITLTAAVDTVVEDTAFDNASSGADPAATLATAVDTFVAGGIWSGQAAPTGITEGAGQTLVTERDFGADVGGISYMTAIQSPGSPSYGWTMATEERVVFAVAVAEGSSGGAVGQAVETDTAQPVTPHQNTLVDTAVETDTALPIAAVTPDTLGQAIETDTALPVGHAKTAHVGQATELDRAKQIAVVGGILPVSEFPVLIRAPIKAGRTFVEVSLGGDTYHPNIADPQAEEEAPGGFGPFTGRVSERIFRAHRDIFQAGARLFWWHEDGTCIHAGTLLEPDTSDGEVQLTDRGLASKADREVGPVLYQAAIGDELAHFAGKSRKWTAEFTRLSHSFTDAGAVFTRDSTGDTGSDGGTSLVIPLFGREPVFMRAHVQGSKAILTVQTARTDKVASVLNSAELDLTNLYENYFLTFTPTTAVSSAEIEVDLTLGGNNLSFPNASPTNVGDEVDTGVGYVYPEVVIIEVGDDTVGTGANRANATEVLISNIEINGVAVGERRSFSAHDLVEDIAALLGIRTTQVEGGGVDILPYELPAGVPAAEALDYASLLTGLRWRIRHNGNRATLEFGPYSEHQWGLASPWAPFDAIPQERFDAVSVPFFYGASQLSDNVVVRIKDSPLERRNVYHGLSLSDPMHNQDKAVNLGGHMVEGLVRKRNAGTFAAAELIGADGQPHTAHHANAGDVLYPMRPYDRGRLNISHLTRFEDHIEGTFDGENHALDKMLARREKRLSRR